MDRMFLHNSNLNNRCYFYGLTHNEFDKYKNSTITVLFNPEYSETKVFDNIYYLSNLYNNSDDEVWDLSFDQIRCYNDYQNSDYVTLFIPSTLQRRERSWTLAVPRNVVAIDMGLYPDIFNVANFDTTRKFKERLRDKYMITDLIFRNNGLNNKFVVSKIGCTYRTSIR
jgi:hypothetical protein